MVGLFWGVPSLCLGSILPAGGCSRNKPIKHSEILEMEASVGTSHKFFLSTCHLEHLILEKVCYCSRRGKSLDVQHEWHMFIDWKMSLGALQCLFPLEPFKYSLFCGELHHCVCLWIHSYWSANCCCLENSWNLFRYSKITIKCTFFCPTSNVIQARFPAV